MEGRSLWVGACAILPAVADSPGSSVVQLENGKVTSKLLTVKVKETAFDLLQDLLFYDTLRISVNGKERKLGKLTVQ